MTKGKRRLADTINDPVMKKPLIKKRKRKKNRMLSKYIISLVIGFAGGFSFARLLR